MSAPPVTSIRAALDDQAVLIVLAGPNGAGKSTFFDQFLASLGVPYVNADLIARVIREARPDTPPPEVDRQAFRQAEELRRALVEARVSFCTETVFSDPVGAKLGFIKDARARGFTVVLVFIGLESAELSIARVMQRVREGGHDVPDAKLRARYPRSLANLRAAIPLVDAAFVFDNSSYDAPYRAVAVYEDGRLLTRQAPVPAWARRLPALY